MYGVPYGENVALINNSMEIYTGISMRHCLLICGSKRLTCRSVNYSESLKRCEMNSKTAPEARGDLVTRQGYVYYHGRCTE